MRLDHVGIHVQNAEGAERYLSEVLGLPLVRRSAPGNANRVAFFSCGNANIETLSPGGGTDHPTEIHHVALGVDDFAATAAELRGRGVRFQGDAPVTSTARTMQMSDPATTGTIYQVIQWFAPSAGSDLPPVDAATPAGGIGVVKLDHIGLNVADMEHSKRFFTETLGLPLREEAHLPERQRRIAFFSLANADLEAVCLDDPAARADQLGDRTAKLDHVALLVEDMDAAVARMKEHGAAFETEQPRRRGNRLQHFSIASTTGGVRVQLLAEVKDGA